MIDPTHFNSSYRPAVIHLVDGSERYVCHQRVTEQGWLWCIDWQDVRRKVPPQRIAHVERVETQGMKDNNGRQWKKVVDDDVIQVVTSDLKQPVAVNGGERA